MELSECHGQLIESGFIFFSTPVYDVLHPLITSQADCATFWSPFCNDKSLLCNCDSFKYFKKYIQVKN